MSTRSPFFNLSEQLCYVHCGFCTTILLVSVPCSSLSKVVTVRCGHCQGLLSVDMSSVPLVPWQLLSSLGVDETKKELIPHIPVDHGEGEPVAEEQEEQDEGEEQEADVPTNTVVNKPPEKRQRAPSAYNCFIKEEIKRIKGRDPGITHKEAFSTAAKNWAHFPRIQQKGEGESCSLGLEKLAGETAGVDEAYELSDNHAAEVLPASRPGRKTKRETVAAIEWKRRTKPSPRRRYQERWRRSSERTDFTQW